MITAIERVHVIFTHQTRLNCEEIEARIEAEAKAFGLMLKKHFPFSKNLPESGFEVKEHASVFELCKAPIAAKLLNTRPELSLLLPCRISVYAKEGRCYAATHDLSVLMQTLPCDAELKDEILGLYENITTMIKGW
jgi:uncharacterized protein (DUF302 family)